MLNPALYRALQQLGPVRVVQEDVPMVAHYVPGLDGRTRLQIVDPGQYFRVNCPYCRDTRHRLWINHRWGVRDRNTHTKNYWLAHCFNENCLDHERNRLDLIERVSSSQAGTWAAPVVQATAPYEEVGRPIGLPRDFVPLGDLPRRHPARRYLRHRDFDPDQLSQGWGVGFSPRDACCMRDGGSLVIPVYRLVQGEPKCWGWQSRAVDPVDEARWRYFTAPRLKRARLLYGLEHVDAGSGPVLICEGVTDVWRAGKNAVALLGKCASDEQLRLAHKHFHGRPVVVMLDPDAQEYSEKLVTRLLALRTESILSPEDTPVVQAHLPSGKDPGDCTRMQLWAIARQALRTTPDDR